MKSRAAATAKGLVFSLLMALSLFVFPALAAPVAGVPAHPGKAGPIDSSASGRPPGMAVTFFAVLQVEEPDKTAEILVARAEVLGGWFTRRAKTSLELRLPTSKADSFIQGLDSLGVLVDRNLTTRNLEGERDELASRLRARKAMLQDYYAMLKESGDSTIFTIQNEIVNLQTEIEQTQGQIVKLEDQMAFAQVTVSFRFQERTAPLTSGASRFKWLNRLDLPSLMNRFEAGRHE